MANVSHACTRVGVQVRHDALLTSCSARARAIFLAVFSSLALRAEASWFFSGVCKTPRGVTGRFTVLLSFSIQIRAKWKLLRE